MSDLSLSRAAVEGSKYLLMEFITIPVFPSFPTDVFFRLFLTEPPVSNEPVITAVRIRMIRTRYKRLVLL